jgi:molybdopterin synthase catalytic subunit
MSLFAIRDSELSVDECRAAVARRDAGAIALFVGTVRDHNAGQTVTSLEYQAYASMAEKEMARIAEELACEYPGVELACLHRVGHLELGDIAVVCAVSSPHRGLAFDVCRQLIDRIKARVPIWKREHTTDGAHWVGWEDARISAGRC